MVIPAKGTDGPEWPRWRAWIIVVADASVMMGAIVWLLSRDKTIALAAAAFPWGIALAFLAITAVWLIMVPLMMLVGRIGGKNQKQTK
jgi:hypothetical protein